MGYCCFFFSDPVWFVIPKVFLSGMSYYVVIVVPLVVVVSPLGISPILLEWLLSPVEPTLVQGSECWNGFHSPVQFAFGSSL